MKLILLLAMMLALLPSAFAVVLIEDDFDDMVFSDIIEDRSGSNNFIDASGGRLDLEWDASSSDFSIASAVLLYNFTEQQVRGTINVSFDYDTTTMGESGSRAFRQFVTDEVDSTSRADIADGIYVDLDEDSSNEPNGDKMKNRLSSGDNNLDTELSVIADSVGHINILFNWTHVEFYINGSRTAQVAHNVPFSGDEFIFLWTNFNTGGSDRHVYIDNLVVSDNTTAEPPADIQTVNIDANDIVNTSDITHFVAFASNATHTIFNSTPDGNLELGGLVNNTEYNITVQSNSTGGYYNLTKTFNPILGGTYEFGMRQAVLYLIGFEGTKPKFEDHGVQKFNLTYNNTDYPHFRWCTGLSCGSNEIPSTEGPVVFNTSMIAEPPCDGICADTTFYYVVELNVTPNEVISVTTNTTGYFSQGVNYSALSPVSHRTEYFRFYEGWWNVTAYDTINDAFLSDFTVTIEDDETGDQVLFNGSGDRLDVYVNNGQNLTLTIESPLLSSRNSTQASIAQFGNLTFNTSFIGSIRFNILDELDRTDFNGSTVTLQLIGLDTNDNTTLQSTTNGSYTFNDLVAQHYLLVYDSTGFDERHYVFKLDVGETGGNETIYLLNEANSTEISYTVRDEDFELLPNAIIQALRFYPGINTYEVVEMRQSSFDGTATMNLQANSPLYKFRILYLDEVIFTSVGAVLNNIHVSNGINFQVNTEDVIFEALQGLQNVDHSLSYDATQNEFTLSYTDTSSSLSEGCLVILEGLEVVNSSCSSSSSTSITIPVDNTTDTTFTAQALFTGTVAGLGTSVPGQTESVTFDFEGVVTNLGNLGLFLAAIYFIAIALSLAVSPKIAMMGSVFAWVIPMFAGFTVLNVAFAATLFVITLVLGGLLTNRQD